MEGYAGAGGASTAGAHFDGVFDEVMETGNYCIVVDCAELFNFSEQCAALYEQIVRYPTEVIPLLDTVARDLCARRMSTTLEEAPPLQVRLYNLREIKSMRDLDPSDVETLVSLRGMVIRASSVIPDLRVAYFECAQCSAASTVPVDRGHIEEPTACASCGARGTMAMVHNRCIFKDKQMVKLQETPESIPEGETPRNVVLYAHDDLVDGVVPGDRVLVTGVFRALPARSNPRQRSLRAVYKSYVDVVHFQKAEKGRLAAEAQGARGEYAPRTLETNLTDQDVAALQERVRALASTPDLYSKLVASLAPSIYEMDDVKKGILLQLFGGANKQIGDQGRFRGEVNVLLCGDPGVSKSQLLSFVHKIAPRGIYTSGKGSSAVGLTAYITKDPETREPVLESGALVLSDRGICCIDEFDKMSDTTRAILHEVMEQQTVSIAKAGIIATLNARTSILAAANPVESRYNPNLSVVDNIKLPPTLLSRFDLIYLLLDRVDREDDKRLAQHIVSLYYAPSDARSTSDLFPLPRMAEYISYARAHVNPELSPEAMRALVQGYMDMRRMGTSSASGRKVITATPRQLESLIRLAEAHARLHLRASVTEADVAEAQRLMNVATQRAATDPVTGTIDMDAITTGRTAAARDTTTQLAEALRDVLSDRPGKRLRLTDVQKLMDANTDVEIAERDLVSALKVLHDEGFLVFNARSRVTTIKTGLEDGQSQNL